MKKAIKEILKFEILYKIITLCLVNPFLNEIYQTYVSSKGVSFNKDIITTFLSVKGILIFLAVFFCTAVFVFYEISVILNILALCRKQGTFTLSQVLKCSVWNLRALKGSSLLFSSIYYILLLPLVSVGYINSMVPNLEIPWFIFGEMQRTTIGRIGVLAIYIGYYGAYFLLIFVPIYMVLGQERFPKAVRKGLLCYKQIKWKGILKVFGAVFVWNFVTTKIVQYWRRDRLENQDFDIYFFKYFAFSEAFRKDFLYWLLIALFHVVAMTLFLFLLISLVMKTDERIKAELHPVWEGDAGIIISLIKKHWRQWKMGWKEKRKKKRYQAAGILCCVLVLFSIGMSFWQMPLKHRPFIIGHRGSIYGIENSIKAIQEADKRDIDYSEIDVQLSKDGVPVVVHDANLWRLAGKAVNVRDLTLKELKELTIRDYAHEGETAQIPTLEEVLKSVKNAPNGLGLLIELKTSGGEGKELASAIIQLVEQYDFGDNAMFMSLDYQSILPIQKIHPEWWAGYCIFGSSGEIDDTIWQYDIDFIAVEQSLVSNRLVTQAREKCLPVYVWTVYDREKMKQYLEMGVIGLIGDVPDDIKEVVEVYHKKNGTSQYEWQGEGYPKEE